MPKGLLTVGASISYENDDAEIVTVDVAKGDSVNIVISVDAIPTTEEIEGAIVVGFVGRPRTVKRGSARMYDGVPTYLPDVDGGGRWETIEETTEVGGIVIDAPVPADEDAGEEAEAQTTRRLVYIDQIVSIEAAGSDGG